jgi:hypothetical protein
MKAWVIAFIGSAVFLLGAAATKGGQDGPPGQGGLPGADSVVGGFVRCFDPGGQVQLFLTIDGAVGIPATFGGATSFSGNAFRVGGFAPGPCADALAALPLPAPLCASGPAPDAGGLPGTSFGFACSGRARDVSEAVGDLAKAVVAP